LFLVNPVAGGGAGAKVARNIKTLLSEDFADEQDRCDVELTQPEGLAGRVRRACSDYSAIVAVGGDGTASWILRGMLQEGGGTRFGLIPLGTGNDLARSLGVYHPGIERSRKALRHALHTALFGETSPMDLFEMNGAGFFCNYAGVGLDGRVLAEYKRVYNASWFKLIRWSRGFKFLCYGFLLFKNLRYRLPEGVQIAVNSGGSLKTLLIEELCRAVIVSNTRTYAGGFVLGPRSKIDDGRFEVTFVRGAGDIFRILLARFSPLRVLSSSLNQVQTDYLEWTAPVGLPFEWDGELGSGPLPEKGSIRIAGQVQVLL
jgi:diacylglycerol kinase family enzyme